MTKREKAEQRLSLWKTKSEEDFRKVEQILLRAGFLSRQRGSHCIFSHPSLKAAYLQDPVALEDFGPLGEITIPTVSGRRVKGFYLKVVLRALGVVEEGAENG